MWNSNTLIGQHIERTNRNLLLSNLAMVATVIGLGTFTWRYWYNFFLGPFNINTQTLHGIQDLENTNQYFVKVTGEKSFNTGLQEISQSKDKYTKQVKSETVKANYLVLLVSGRILIIKANPNTNTDTQFTGQLVKLPDDVSNELVTIAKNPDIKNAFLPVMLETDDFHTAGYFGLGIGLPLLLFGGWNLLQYKQRKDDPKKHPIMQSLAQYGEPELIAGNIESEFQVSSKFTLGDVTMSPYWFFRKTTFGLDILLLKDVVWSYKKITQHSTNGIPTGKSFGVLVYNQAGNLLEFPVKNEAQADQVIIEVATRVPCMSVGFSPELQELWDKHKNDFIAGVNERKNSMDDE